MTREIAERTAEFIEEQLIKPQELLVLVNILEKKDYRPRVLIGKKILRCSVVANPDERVGEDWVVKCETAEINYFLNNPHIDDTTRTLSFRDRDRRDPRGRQIFQSFTLMRPCKDNKERWLWERWRNTINR